MWINPPDGFKYGFPKVWDRTTTIQEWLIENGYPENQVDFAVNNIQWWSAEQQVNNYD